MKWVMTKEDNMTKDMMNINASAWGKLAYDHYLHFKEKLSNPDFKLNPIVTEELGDIRGKKILHLQCNTGADSILMARMGAIVTGVDFAKENIDFARQLASDFGMDNMTFIESDVLTLFEKHQDEYDIVLTTDGVLGWLPDLDKWGKVIARFLKKDGFFYLHDSHPFMMIFDENALCEGQLIPKYPYFDSQAEISHEIGGYASESKVSKNYFWGHTMSAILNGLIQAKLTLIYFKEYDRCVSGMGGCDEDEKGLKFYKNLEGKLPIVMSLKAMHL